MCACNSKEENNLQLTKLWKNEGISWNSTSLFISDDYLYGSTLNASIFKINIKNGHTIWESPSSTSYSGQKPLIKDDRVYIGGHDVLNSYDLNGNLIWSKKIGHKIGYTLLNDDSLIIGSLRSKGLFAFDSDTGNEVWENVPDYQMLSSSRPSIKDSLIIIGDFDYSLEKSLKHTKAINAQNGKVLWSIENKGYFTGEALFLHDKIFISFDSAYKKGKLVSLSMIDGSILWETTSNPEMHYKPTIIDTLLLVPSYERSVDCFNLKNGELVWSLNSDEYIPNNEIVVFNGSAYFSTNDREIIQLNLDGSIQAKTRLGYGIGAILNYGDRLLMAIGDGYLYELNKPEQ